MKEEQCNPLKYFWFSSWNVFILLYSNTAIDIIKIIINYLQKVHIYQTPKFDFKTHHSGHSKG